jgi:hypothetical protein
MTEEDLKEKLRGIVQKDYEVTREEAKQLLPEMLQHIGNPDPELRDTLIYFTLATWISRNVFDLSELQTLLHTVLNDEHLFYRIGEENTDSVFTRAFSALLVPPILSVHRQQPFLKPEILKSALQRVMLYLHSEKDLRGYVREKGWAHAVAHTADALDEFVQCTEIGRDELWGMLELIAEIVSTGRTVYTHGEDERLAFAVLNTFKRTELTELDKEGWLQWFTSLVYGAGETPDPEGYITFINIKHFLRTLYFYLLESDVSNKNLWNRQIQQQLNYYRKL